MQRYSALVDIKAQAAVGDVAGESFVARPSEKIREGKPVPPGFAPVHTFEAESDADADRYLRHIQDVGVPRDGSIGNAGRVAGSSQWRWRGAPHHAHARAGDFGLSPHHERLVQACPHIRRITCILGPQCDLYHATRRVDGVAQVEGRVRQQVRATLADAEHEVTTIAFQLACAVDAMDQAYRAFGIEAGEVGRRFALSIVPPAAEPDQPAESPAKRTKPSAGSK